MLARNLLGQNPQKIPSISIPSKITPYLQIVVSKVQRKQEFNHMYTITGELALKMGINEMKGMAMALNEEVDDFGCFLKDLLFARNDGCLCPQSFSFNVGKSIVSNHLAIFFFGFTLDVTPVSDS